MAAAAESVFAAAFFYNDVTVNQAYALALLTTTETNQ